MKLAYALLPALLLAACVPSTDDLDPRGAAGFVMDPSPATRGEPFDTKDGYRITIDRLVLLMTVQVDPFPGDYSNADSTLVDVNAYAPAYCPAVAVGDAHVSAYLTQLAVGESYDEPRVELGARRYLSRFRAPADLQLPRGEYYDGMFVYGPSVLVAFHAEGHGKRYAAELTLESVVGPSSSTYESVVVAADQLTTKPLPIHAEELFVEAGGFDCLGFDCEENCTNACLDGCISSAVDVEICQEACSEACVAVRPRSKDPLFEPFARRDADGDGILTAAELDTLDPVSEDGLEPLNLGKELLDRTAKLLGPLPLDYRASRLGSSSVRPSGNESP